MFIHLIVYGLSNWLTYKNHGLNPSWTTIFWCLTSAFLDLFFRLILLAYLFSVLSFYAFLLPLIYFFLFSLFFSIFCGLKTAFREHYHFCISFVASAYDHQKYNYRHISKGICNSLAIIFLCVAFSISLQNNNHNLKSNDCQNMCSQNVTIVSECHNSITLTTDETYVFIAVTSSFFVLSVLEGIFEACCPFMPWRMYSD